MKLVIARSARKTLTSVPTKLAAGLLTALAQIAEDPFGDHPNAKRLKGGADEFRLRHGDWRAVYRLDRAAGHMIVTVIETRGGVYR